MLLNSTEVHSSYMSDFSFAVLSQNIFRFLWGTVNMY